MTEYVWEPLSVDDVSALFARFNAPWWVAGGWAIDLHIGRQTRPHADIDLAVLRGDQPELQRLLGAGWEPHVAHDGALMPWPAGDWLEPPRHQFWVRRRGSAAWAFEVLLEDAQAGVWAYRKDARITLPLSALGRLTDDGVPYVAPEVALLYKATSSTIKRNAADFDSALPLLAREERLWLSRALALVSPEHPWLARLDAVSGAAG